jgi:hypothetical protein
VVLVLVCVCVVVVCVCVCGGGGSGGGGGGVCVCLCWCWCWWWWCVCVVLVLVCVSSDHCATLASSHHSFHSSLGCLRVKCAFPQLQLSEEYKTPNLFCAGSFQFRPYYGVLVLGAACRAGHSHFLPWSDEKSCISLALRCSPYPRLSHEIYKHPLRVELSFTLGLLWPHASIPLVNR